MPEKVENETGHIHCKHDFVPRRDKRFPLDSLLRCGHCEDAFDANQESHKKRLKRTGTRAYIEAERQMNFEALNKVQKTSTVTVTKTTCIIDLSALKKALGLPTDAAIRVSRPHKNDFELGESANIYAQWEIEEEQ